MYGITVAEGVPLNGGACGTIEKPATHCVYLVS